MKLNQSEQDMSIFVVIQFGEKPDCNQKVIFNFTFLVLVSLIVNVFFCPEDGSKEYPNILVHTIVVVIF